MAVMPLSFVWLEITGKCQLACNHCYADSGRHGTHGNMTTRNWSRVIEEAAGLGVGMVQFIGGEPTLHPGLPSLIELALGLQVEVEVYSNLVHIPAQLWDIFEQPGVRLATSYYSGSAKEHDAITRRKSHDRTLMNIREMLQRGIPLRVGIIAINSGQRVTEAVDELRDMGVTDIGVDHLREVGRGIRQRGPDFEQLCGECASGKLAISSSGEVWPCVLARWLPVGNVHQLPLVEIERQAEETRSQLRTAFSQRSPSPCVPPNPCPPLICPPTCPPACSPSRPA
jgi:MoaA/NifB/PqqE/SkfB family radical SAM enzyme